MSLGEGGRRVEGRGRRVLDVFAERWESERIGMEVGGGEEGRRVRWESWKEDEAEARVVG
jgi:hypothetical protein